MIDYGIFQIGPNAMKMTRNNMIDYDIFLRFGLFVRGKNKSKKLISVVIKSHSYKNSLVS